MAHKIAEGARSKGCEVEVFDATEINPDDHVDRIENADALLLGSPTINNNVVKPVWDVLNSLISIDVKGKVAGSFGSYGYSQFNPSEGLYNSARALGILLLLVMLVSVLVHGPPSSHALFLLTVISALILLGASLMSNWNIVYQPQGRYLAPILAMAGVLFYHVRKHLDHGFFYPVIAAMYLMSLYSFIFIGLRFLEKT